MNSGRLETISATVSPRRTPSAARPPAKASTFAASSVHVQAISSSFVRTAIAVRVVLDGEPKRLGDRRGAYRASLPHGGTLPQTEPAVLDSLDVVLRPITNSIEHEREAHEPGPLHDVNGIALPRTFSASAQKMCPPSSGRNGNRLMTPRRREINASTITARSPVDRDRRARRLVAADDAADLLAFLGMKICAMWLTVVGRDVPHLVQRLARRTGPGRGRAHARPGRSRSRSGSAAWRLLSWNVLPLMVTCSRPSRSTVKATACPCASPTSSPYLRELLAVVAGQRLAVDGEHLVALLELAVRPGGWPRRCRPRAAARSVPRAMKTPARITNASTMFTAGPGARSRRSASTPAGGSRRGGRAPAGSPPPGSCR